MIIIAILILGVTVEQSLAQMGHGMMRGGHMTEQDDHMKDENGMMGDKEYKQLDDIFTRKQKPTDEMSMHHRQMISGMMGAAQDMAIMMRQMSVMMGDITKMENKAGNQYTQRISAMMKDMAVEMNRISGMMGKGTATPEEVRAMQDRMIGMQEQMRELNR
jgi:hypothetical protein